VAEQLLGDKSERVLTAACKAIATNKVKSAGPHLLTLVKNTTAPAKGRVAAFDALVSLGVPELAAAADAAQNDPLAALHTAAAKELAAAFPKAANEDKKDIIDALGGLPGAEADFVIASLVADLAGQKIPVDAQLELIEAAEKRNSPLVKEKLSAWQNGFPATD